MASRAAKAQLDYYRAAKKRILAALEDLQLDIAADFKEGKVSRTELWNYAKYRKLLEVIDSVINETGTEQVALLDELIADIFEETTETELDELNESSEYSFQMLDAQTVKQQISQDWNGSNYSSRVWKNTNTLAARLREDMTNLIVMGRNHRDIAAQLSHDMNVAYSVADRLIRTEANHTYNTAAINRYKAAGIEEVRVQDNAGSCPVCAKAAGIYKIGEAPMLPIHPYCKCRYIPVVKI